MSKTPTALKKSSQLQLDAFELTEMANLLEKFLELEEKGADLTGAIDGVQGFLNKTCKKLS
jgi:hypothetical protein